MKKAWNEYLERNAQWVTARGGKGLMLQVFDQKNRVYTPVLKESKKPIIFTWEEIELSKEVREELKPWWGGN